MLRKKQQWQPRWLRGLAPPSAQGVILETWDGVPRGAPCMEPASPSACVFASLSLSFFVCVSTVSYKHKINLFHVYVFKIFFFIYS